MGEVDRLSHFLANNSYIINDEIFIIDTSKFGNIRIEPPSKIFGKLTEQNSMYARTSFCWARRYERFWQLNVTYVYLVFFFFFFRNYDDFVL